MANIRHDLQLYDRTPDYNIKHSREYNPNRYISIQSRVNDDPDYETEYFAKLISEGWFKLEDNRAILKDEVKGRHFKYRLNGNGLSNAEKGTFRSGGIIIGRKNSLVLILTKWKARANAHAFLPFSSHVTLCIQQATRSLANAKGCSIIC